MMSMLFTLVALVLLFGLTIFVHELGHYLVARWCGMKIEVFSIGFGPALWSWTRKGIRYKIGALPLGGYVALPQMDPTGGEAARGGETATPDDASAAPDPALPAVAPWKRILVSAAGASGNILFAILIAWVVFHIGKPSAPHERRCVVGYVEPASPAWEAGLRIGDTIAAVNGQPVGNWQDLLTVLTLRADGEVTLRMRGFHEEEWRETTLATKRSDMGLSILPGAGMEQLCRVWRVVPDGSAEAAGMQPGDLILAVEGIRVFSIPHLIDLIQERSGREVPFLVRRDGEEKALQVRPAPDPEDGIPRIGIRFDTNAVDFDEIVHPRPAAQLREHATAILRLLRSLITPSESRAAAGAIGGPVFILYYLWLMRQSMAMAIWFTGFLNINLAILNLLPIPILDGGHILFASYEMVTRRPANAKLVAWVHRVFATLLISLILLLTFRDTLRLILRR